MQIIDLLSPQRVRVGVTARSKKRLLEQATDLLCVADDDINPREVFSSLCGRERISSTALGYGVAIPHGRVPTVSAAHGCMIRLREPIDFDASDDAGVDLVFALVVPEQCPDEHLKLLAQLAELFSDSARRDSLRQAESANKVLDIISEWQSQRGNE